MCCGMLELASESHSPRVYLRPARDHNPYMVDSGGGRNDNRDTRLFNEWKEMTTHFTQSADRALICHNGEYECCFLKNGLLFSGTTRNRPCSNQNVKVQALHYYGREGPSSMSVPAQSDNIIWNIICAREETWGFNESQ